MCGISGFINLPDQRCLAEKAGRVQGHRGPDSTDIWEEDQITLVHNRLSIIDPNERSNQPFVKDGLVIIFNGEIYNYKELQQLILEEAPATTFRTTSDTEVLLELFRLRREKCLDLLVGMFAFALYDQRQGTLFLARDHFGIKPLFYTFIGEGFAFASELKTLTGVPGFDKTINQDALVSAMNYLWVSGDESMFKGCSKLPPAHYFTVNCRGTIKATPLVHYWQPGTTVKFRDEAETLSLLSKSIVDSIHRHMIADVPVSSFLSGGLDSSLISAVAREVNPHLSTYTIGTSAEDKKAEQMPEDEKYARMLADQMGFDHHEIMLQPDIVKDLQAMVYTLDEPIGDPAAINTWLICKAARERGVKVLLSGMGADELLFGYRRQKATLMAARYRKIPAPFRRLIKGVAGLLPVKAGGKGIRLTRWAKRFLSFADLPAEEAYMRSYSYYDQQELGKLFRSDISDSFGRLRDQHARLFNAHYRNDLVNQMCFTDIGLFMTGLNLTYSDRASMAASVEVRVPFIDKKVVETAMAIDGSLKYKNKQSKYILKKVAEKYLPRDIIYRPKASFGAPIRSWIGGPLRSMVDDILSKESVEKRGIFNYGFVKELIDNDRLGKDDNAYRIYQLLTVELWCRTYLDGTQAAGRF